MSSCKACDKELLQQKNKRKKEFCNSTCRSGFWQKQKRTQNKAQEGEETLKATDSTKRVSKEKSNAAEVPKKTISDTPSISISDLTQPTGIIKPSEQPKTNFVINTADKPTIPEKMPGENPFDFAERKNEWKRLYG